MTADTLTTTGRPGVPSPGRFRRSLAARQRAELWGFLAPAIVFFVVFFLFPLGYGVFMSTTDFQTGTFITGRAPFVGTANFEAILAEPVTLRALANTLTITIVSVVVELVLGLLLALLFARRFPGSRWLPTLILLPWLLPAVVVATVWKSLLAGDGPLNDVLHALGIPAEAWLANPATALPAVILVAVWASLPYWATILGAALKQVPAEQLEAAQLDGAGAWRRLTAIVLPTIWPVISVLVVMSVVYTLLIVDLVLVLTAGGPANSTVTLGLLSYRQAFQQFQFGLGGAYGMLLLGISILFAIVYTVMSMRRERDQ
ncbi:MULTISPECIES: carbohydrate ABC transporter permease [Microbacterium]|uniref:carbohydrate ABC transporter permease n=1 Tax=Microbacterium TaxID=33882 RepID=UPI001D179385|nr:sugar ABC transporter permease [Microbacterium testaceum]MCC4250087.1 sugar ABC transporter permease [Microbacterium testaceum]